MVVSLIVLGALFGAIFGWGGWFGPLLGAVMGMVAGWVIGLRRQVSGLQARVQALERMLPGSEKIEAEVPGQRYSFAGCPPAPAEGREPPATLASFGAIKTVGPISDQIRDDRAPKPQRPSSDAAAAGSKQTIAGPEPQREAADTAGERPFDIGEAKGPANEPSPAPGSKTAASDPGHSAGSVQSPAVETGSGMGEGAKPTGAYGPPGAPSFVDQTIGFVRDLFTQGNPIVRVGVVLLFFGVAFLLKYASDQGAVPIEARLLGVAAGGLIMLVLGWRLRLTNRIYALVMQGGGVGVLYLTIFAAARLYHIMPLWAAFVFMVGLVALSCGLAVRQNGSALAAFGSAGGFLAPVLTSTGEGSHVALFAYYAILNTGIAGVSWFRAWRGLNVLGFFFTFVIATAWGYQYYQPAFFTTTEPFLVLFYAQFLLVSVLFALKQPPQLKGFVDGTLVFGVPLVGFALQAALVQEFEYGLAVSAAVLGLVYSGLATALWSREHARMLAEAFIALGIGFVTLAIPLAMGAEWTAAAWALEGAGLLWVGARQRRLLPRLSGVLLQLMAGISYEIGGASQYFSLFNVADVHFWSPEAATAPSVGYLGTLLISLGGFVAGWCLHRYRDSVRAWEKAVSVILMVWGLWWWFRGGVAEIDQYLVGDNQVCTIWLFSALTALALSRLSPVLRWPVLAVPSTLILPAFMASGLMVVDGGSDHVLVGWGIVPWAVFFGVMTDMLYRYRNSWPKNWLTLLHVGTAWVGIVVLTFEAAWLGADVWHWPVAWQNTLKALPALLGAAALLWWGQTQRWPFVSYGILYQHAVARPAVVLLALWGVGLCGTTADPDWMPYVPVLNPVEVLQIAIVVLVGSVLARPWGKVDGSPAAVSKLIAGHSVGISGFVLLNVMLARGVHHWTGVAYQWDALLHSLTLQTVSMTAWTLFALAAVVLGRFWRHPPSIFVGVVVLPALALAEVYSLAGGQDVAGLHWLFGAWAAAALSLYDVAWRCESGLRRNIAARIHVVGAWAALFFTVLSAGLLVHYIWQPPFAWEIVGRVLPALLAGWVVLTLVTRDAWPFRRFSCEYREWFVAPVTVLLVGWVLIVCSSTADPVWLPYVPLLNPVELAQIGVVALTARLVLALRREGASVLPIPTTSTIAYLVSGLSFIVLNAIIARAVHHWSGVAYDLEALFQSTVFQSATSVSWTLLSLLVMVLGARRGERSPWIAGAVLLGVVIVKLFLVDLAGVDSLGRIVSFMAVGGLTLVIGYFSPLPPRLEKAA